MWTCNLCGRSFRQANQHHYCSDSTVGNFIAGKTETALMLFDLLMEKFREFGPVKVHATKSMLVISADYRFAYIIQFGKNFLDVVLPFKELYENNLCFRKMGQVPGSNDYNHHLRLMLPDDLNEEVCGFLQRAYQNGKAVSPY